MAGRNSQATAGGDDEGMLQLRRSIAASVLARMKARIPGLSAHFGEDCEQSDDAEAAVYRSTGASFRWVAFAFSPWRMWDLHVGVVPTDERHLSVGFHVSERASPLLLGHLERLGAELGAPAKHQPAALEYQANLPLIDVRSATPDSLTDTIAQLCSRYAAVAAAVPCPAEMRDRTA